MSTCRARLRTACLALFLFAPGAGTVSAEPPHIVIFLADDLGWKSVGFNGGEFPTPQIDRLARDGVRFEQFYVQPLCSPTRAALLTGRYPIRYGLQVGVVNVWDSIGLPTRERTLAQELKKRGYRTAIVGKWHLGIHRPEYLPTRRGFDHQYGSYSANIDYFTHEKMGILDWHRDDRPLEEEGHATDLTAREAVRLIDEHEPGRPLFLYIPFQAAHTPRKIPPAYESRFRDIVEERRRVLAGMLAQMDDAVGSILGALRRREMLANTVVFFTTDNGAPMTSGDLRGGKGSVYEGAMRVPAAMMWLDGLEKGKVVRVPVHVTDLFPTLLGLAGGELGEELVLDGVDVWGTIARGEPSPRKEILHNLSRGRGAIRVGPWKLIVSWSRPGEGSGEKTVEQLELFRVDSDPRETEELSARHPDKVAELLARLRHYESEAVEPLKGARSAPPQDFRFPEVWGPPTPPG